MSEITVTIIEQTIDIPTRVGIDGDDAFEVWLKILGNEDKTFQDWLDWVRQPATEAATEIGELEDEVRLAELDRRDQEIIRGNNENIRKQNEIDRGLAEGGREIVKQEMIDERLVSEELNDHPPILMDVSGRQLWHYWDLTSHSYISTGLPGAFNFVSNDLVSYQKYDVTQVNGTSYISLVDNNTSPIQEGTKWKTIAKVGRTPQFEIGEVTTTEEGTHATVTITLTGYDVDQNPQYTVDYSIPRGNTGKSAYDVYGEGGGTLGEAAFNTLLSSIETVITDAELATNLANEAAITANNASDALLSNVISLEIRDDMHLYMTTPDVYSGFMFKIENGSLIAII